MNERSSRSHSVFTLRIRGTNPHTGEACEGSLNLVDLAGSERLEKSGAAGDKDRLKETQAINKSLSALGDVIAALGEKSEKGDKHIPYRNSKVSLPDHYRLSAILTFMFFTVDVPATELLERELEGFSTSYCPASISSNTLTGPTDVLEPFAFVRSPQRVPLLPPLRNKGMSFSTVLASSFDPDVGPQVNNTTLGTAKKQIKSANPQ